MDCGTKERYVYNNSKILNLNFLLFSSKIKRRQLYLKFEYFMIIIFSECVNLQSEN